MRTFVLIPDLHFPWHDPLYVDCVTRVLKFLRPNGGVIQFGDFVDWPQLGSYVKKPGKNTARDDIEMYQAQMVKWAALLPRGATWHQICGNHEYRAVRYMWGRAPDMADLMHGVQDMLGIKELNKTHHVKFKFHDYEDWDSLWIGDTLATHGYYFSKNTAAGNIVNYMYNVVHGHNHRVQYIRIGKIWSATIGHGSLEAKTNHKPAPPGWAQAISVLTEVDGKCSIEIAIVENGKCVLRGREI